MKNIYFLLEIETFKVQDEFFFVECSSGGHTYNNVHFSFNISKNVLERCQKNKKKVIEDNKKQGLNPPPLLNVHMFFLDSVSRMTYMRKLPKTYSFLKNVLNATILKG